MTPASRRALFLPAVLALAAGAAGCASRGPETYVVVVPAEDGHVGAVVVDSGADRQVLDSAYAAARSGQPGQLQRFTASEQDVASRFGEVRRAKPPAAAAFVVNFILATDQLTPDSQRRLEEISDDVARRGVADILVVGHTDRQGTDENNLALSQRRAERVKHYLVERGISADIIRTVGRGEREPLVETADEAQEPSNRRVEINVR